MKERHYFCTPLNSPSKVSPDVEANAEVGNSFLTVHPSPIMSSHSGSDDKINPFWDFKFPLSESPSAKSASDGEETSTSKTGSLPRRHRLDDATEKNLSNSVGRTVSEASDPVLHRFGGPFDDISIGNVKFDLEDDRDGSKEPGDALKKFTMSPEFLYLKNSLTAEENQTDENGTEKDTFRLDGPFSFPAKTYANDPVPRKTSWTDPSVKFQFRLPRKSSLNGLDSKGHASATPILIASYSEKQLSSASEKEKLGFRTRLIPKIATEKETEEPWSSNGLGIFESPPDPPSDSNFACPVTYDVAKLKKPSTHLGDLLDYCKKTSNFKAQDGSGNFGISKTSHGKPSPLLKKASGKNISQGGPSGKNFGLLGSKEKCRNLTCCVQQYQDSEVLFGDTKDSDARYCITADSGKHGSKRSDSETKNQDKKNGKKYIPSRRETSDLRKSQRADQSYCDILKQQHEEIRKHRIKLPKKRLERICRSDPPDKTIINNNNNNNSNNLNTCECDNFRDLNKKKGKVNLERLESFYDNKTSSDRIESMYENPSTITGTNAQVPERKNFSFYKEDSKSDIALVQASWWPVTETDDRQLPDLPWSWIPSFQVGLELELIPFKNKIEQTYHSMAVRSELNWNFHI